MVTCTFTIPEQNLRPLTQILKEWWRSRRQHTLARAHREAAKGAAYLDVHAPGWHTKVTIGQLEVSSLRACVLAQLFGNF